MKNPPSPPIRKGGEISIVLAGASGMGGVYLEALLRGLENKAPDGAAGGEYRIAGVVDPFSGRCPWRDDLDRRGIPIFPELADFYARRDADLAIISSPHQFHAAQTILAVSKGSDVLCEKPAAVTVQDSAAMREAEKLSGRWVAVAYQWSFSSAIQNLKSDILSGRFGRPRRMRCLYLWPREYAYYARNSWAGRIKDDRGNWVLDGPANNAVAHDLHNIFYLLGDSVDGSARPARVEAELCRAYPIENYDTAAARIWTTGGVEILFLVSHVSAAERGPVCSFEFERGTVLIDGRTIPVRADFADGSRREYGIPDAEPLRKLWMTIDGVRTGTRPVCGLEAAESQTLAINGFQESAGEALPFPSGSIREAGEGKSRRLAVEGLDEALLSSYECWKLPSEIGVPWARRGKSIDLTSYSRFPSLG